MSGFMACTMWYLIVCSVLMVGQYYLERHFGRGFGTTKAPKNQELKAKMVSVGNAGAGNP